MQKRWTTLALAALVVASCSLAGLTPEQTADTIYAGGDIVTVNDAQPTAEAVAVKDGKILAVGARGEMEKAHKGSDTTVLDLDGKTLAVGSTKARFEILGSTAWGPVQARGPVIIPGPS